jgi:hypothetical protein
MLIIPCILLQTVYQPKNALNKLNSWDVLDDSPRWHTSAILRESTIPSLGAGLVLICSRTLPEDGTSVPKQIAFFYLS